MNEVWICEGLLYLVFNHSPGHACMHSCSYATYCNPSSFAVKFNPDSPKFHLTLTRALKKCKAKYSPLGVQLGVQLAKINEFEKLSGDNSSCFQEVLRRYIESDKDTPSVEDLCCAVKELDMTKLSRELETKYRGKYCMTLTQ